MTNKLTNPSQEQLFNKVFNDYQDFSHITDTYLREKLQKGHIKYDSKEWSELCNLSEDDEMELRRGGIK